MRKTTIASALAAYDAHVRPRLAAATPALLLDYDGTLARIAPRPELATPEPGVAQVLAQLAQRCPVAVVTGRTLESVRELLDVPGAYWAASYGFEIEGPALSHRAAPDLPPTFAALADALRDPVAAVPGAWVEPKLYGVSVHYRQADETHLPVLQAAVDQAVADNPDLRVGHYKKVIEVRPTFAWDKGRVATFLLDAWRPRAPLVPVALGDDQPDEPMFDAVGPDGIPIFVGPPPAYESAAQLRLEHAGEVVEFLRRVVGDI